MRHYELDLGRDVIEYTTIDPYEADPNWTYTDKNGHRHDASKTTLQWVITDTYITEDGDEIDEGEYRCTICGEVIEPGRRYVGNGPHYLPGLKHGTLKIGGGTYYLRPDEIEAIGPSVTDEWLDRVTARQPDEYDGIAAMREP